MIIDVSRAVFSLIEIEFAEISLSVLPFFLNLLKVIMKRIICGLLSLTCIYFAPQPLFSAEKGAVANYQILFSPEDCIADKLISLIKKEKKSIMAAVYCLMHKDIIQALIDAHRRGVRVEVIVDPFSAKAHAPARKMEEFNLPVFVWSPPYRYKKSKKGKQVKQRKPLMHDKFCVFGDSCVWTGSFNFTFEASHSNRENVVVLENAQIGSSYLEEFERIKKAGCVRLRDYPTLKN
jgi:phosphatidylserine/phosphatidylglycerophosphate/cardiolipin synthase-like enzyme